MLSAGVVSVSAMSQADFNNRIAQQQIAYPNGSVCYSTQFGQSCFGWAYLMGNNVFGSSPYNWATSYSLSSVKIGDIIQYGNTEGQGHTVFVVGVSGDIITFADCNGNGNGTRYNPNTGKYEWIPDLCKVKWDNTTTISSNSLFSYSFSYIKSAPEIVTDIREVDLGTNFYSIIKNNYRNTVLTGVEGNNVQSYSLFGSLAQWWKFENCGNNEYKITNCYYGKCLDVYCGLTNNNTNVDLYQSNDTDAQRWLIKESSTGFVIVPKCAPSLCVDLENVSAYDGTNIQIYSCNLNDAQIYSIPFRMQSPPCDLGNSFNSTILHTGSGKALTNSDNMIRLYSKNGNYSQAWAFYKDSDCSYQIISLKGWGQCLDVNCGLPYNGTIIDLYESNDTDAQRWFIIKEGDRKYRLIPRCSSTRTLDLIYGNTSDGTGFQIYDYNQSSAQYYNIIPNSLPFEPIDYGNQFNARIINIGTNKYIIGASSKNVEISGEKASNSIWTFTKNQDGSYRITNMKYQLCLDVENGYQYEHTNIQVSNPNDTNAQKWFLVKSGNDVAFIPACAFMRSMDVKETNSTDGTNVELYTYQESQAQKFEVEFMCAIGDTNLDGNININDVTAIQRHIAELELLTEEELSLADTNGDGEINIADATHLQMYLAEYDVVLGKT